MDQPPVTEIVEQSVDQHQHTGLVRTDVHCHNCSKGFIAELDYSLNGEQVAECPSCGHHHYRKIENGKITEARWSSDNRKPDDTTIKCRNVWKHDVLKMKTSTASAFIRNRWLNFGRD